MNTFRKWIFICGATVVLLVVLDRVFPAIECGYPISNRQRSQLHLQHVVTGCSAYRVEFGNWPQGDTGKICEALFGGNPRGIVFLTVEPRFRDAKGKVLDAWRTALHINISHEGVTVTSAGKDRQFDTADDMAISKRT